MKKKRFLATGGLVTSMLIAGATQSYAQVSPTSNQGIVRSKSLEIVSEDLGINEEDFREELRSGKTPKEVLIDQGFNPAQIHKLFKEEDKYYKNITRLKKEM